MLCTALHYTVLYSTALQITALYYNTLYFTVMHYTNPLGVKIVLWVVRLSGFLKNIRGLPRRFCSSNEIYCLEVHRYISLITQLWSQQCEHSKQSIEVR